jgi:hypothetical protein
VNKKKTVNCRKVIGSLIFSKDYEKGQAIAKSK